MKRFVLSFLGLSLAYSLQAQITLTNANVPVTAGPRTENYGNLNTLNPARGANQTWNYGNMTLSSFGTRTYLNATNPQFAGSVEMPAEGELAPGWVYYYNAFLKGTPANFGVAGHEVKTQRYSLTQFTGGPTDSLIFPAQTYTLPVTDAYLNFPATAGSRWQTTHKHILNAQITVAMAMLNKAPMQRRSNITTTDSVIGWGTMRVPVASLIGTQPSIPYPVLMIKRIEVAVDSFYLNGAPAPALLLGGLGVSQGQIRKNNKYKFHRENAMQPLMVFDYGTNNFTSARLITSDNSAAVIAGTTPDFATKTTVQLYPNPVAGASFTVAFEKPETRNWHLRLADLTGREILTNEIKTTGSLKQNLALPHHVRNGLYTWQLLDESGAVRNSGKLQVSR